MQGVRQITWREYDDVYRHNRVDYLSIGEIRRLVSAVDGRPLTKMQLTLHADNADLNTEAAHVMDPGSHVEAWVKEAGEHGGVFCLTFFWGGFGGGTDREQLRVYKTQDDWYWVCLYCVNPRPGWGSADYWRCDQLSALLSLIGWAGSDPRYLLAH